MSKNDSISLTIIESFRIEVIGMKEFFGFCEGEFPYGRPADGFLSWQHIVMVSTFLIVGVALAIFLGKRNKNKV